MDTALNVSGRSGHIADYINGGDISAANINLELGAWDFLIIMTLAMYIISAMLPQSVGSCSQQVDANPNQVTTRALG